MSEAFPVRVILDAPGDAAWHMARDEALLEAARARAGRGVSPVLRRAFWRAPDVTLGRFQPYAVLGHEGRAVSPVRRITGGGAIFHGTDCTLAAVLPRERLPSGMHEIAATFARSLSTALAEVLLDRGGAKPDLRGGGSDERGQRDVVDCFARTSPFDLVLEGRKVGGFALHRRGMWVLLQASVLRDPVQLVSDLDGALLSAWARALGGIPEPCGLTAEEVARAGELEASRYRAREWNEKQ